jgi:hypothetical protein
LLNVDVGQDDALHGLHSNDCFAIHTNPKQSLIGTLMRELGLAAPQICVFFKTCLLQIEDPFEISTVFSRTHSCSRNMRPCELTDEWAKSISMKTGIGDSQQCESRGGDNEWKGAPPTKETDAISRMGSRWARPGNGILCGGECKSFLTNQIMEAAS